MRMGANPPRQLLTLQESARTKQRRSLPPHLLQQQSLLELDQSNLRQSKLKKQNLRGCISLEVGGEREGWGRWRQQHEFVAPRMRQQSSLPAGLLTA